LLQGIPDRCAVHPSDWGISTVGKSPYISHNLFEEF